jgi:hypothetical protein
MTVYNPEWRVKINQTEVTSVTLVNLSITEGRQTIYQQTSAGYCQLTLITDPSTAVPYQINDGITIEVKDSNGDFVNIFGGFITDVEIQVAYAGSINVHQEVRITSAGALARLVRANYEGNLQSDYDGDQILALLTELLLNNWNEVPPSLNWDNYEPTVTWENAENTGLGEIDTPGDFELDSQNNLNDSIYNIAANVARSGLGYLYEDNQGRIGYADSTHRAQKLATDGFTIFDAREAVGAGLRITKRAGDVRNKISLLYGSSQNQSVTDSDEESISIYGQLATTIPTFLKNQSDAETQAAFYLTLRAYPQFEFPSIIFPLGNPEIGDVNRDALLAIEMGLPVRITNLPQNMESGVFEGFVEGWTWRASVNGLSLELNLSPLPYSLQAFKWLNVDGAEEWQTISSILEWQDATIVA